jgi:hypothetical protein
MARKSTTPEDSNAGKNPVPHRHWSGKQVNDGDSS